MGGLVFDAASAASGDATLVAYRAASLGLPLVDALVRAEADVHELATKGDRERRLVDPALEQGRVEGRTIDLHRVTRRAGLAVLDERDRPGAEAVGRLRNLDEALLPRVDDRVTLVVAVLLDDTRLHRVVQGEDGDLVPVEVQAAGAAAVVLHPDVRRGAERRRLVAGHRLSGVRVHHGGQGVVVTPTPRHLRRGLDERLRARLLHLGDDHLLGRRGRRRGRGLGHPAVRLRDLLPAGPRVRHDDGSARGGRGRDVHDRGRRGGRGHGDRAVHHRRPDAVEAAIGRGVVRVLVAELLAPALRDRARGQRDGEQDQDGADHVCLLAGLLARLGGGNGLRERVVLGLEGHELLLRGGELRGGGLLVGLEGRDRLLRGRELPAHLRELLLDGLAVLALLLRGVLSGARRGVGRVDRVLLEGVGGQVPAPRDHPVLVVHVVADVHGGRVRGAVHALTDDGDSVEIAARQVARRVVEMSVAAREGGQRDQGQGLPHRINSVVRVSEGFP